ncbi:DNA primase family protein [Methylobacterium sp. CM6244]
MTDDPRHDIARLVDEAQPIGAEPVGGEGEEFDPSDSWGGGDPPEPPFGDGEDAGDDPGKPNADDLAWCATLDHSDTDNGKRLIRHFGADLSVVAQDEVSGGSWLAWTGTHWDLAGGLARANVVVQRLGGRIILESEFIHPTPREKAALDEARALEGKAKAELTDDEKVAIGKGAAAADALDKRRGKRRAFGVSSKNKARMEAALFCAGPRLRRNPDAYNADRYRVACLTHTLSFRAEQDLECPDPDVKRLIGMCDAIEGHRRDDWITAVVPQPYREDAEAPLWRGFLERMLPDADKRRTVQIFTALGLLSVPVQHLMFHYGLGANGKSVFLETVARVLGPSLAVGLPRESIVGGSERASGGASPDIARLYGRRFVRVLEVAGNVPLQEDMIKKLTGGEPIPVRSLYKGYFEFQNFATPHMSGNDYPTITGTDNGIWRRMLLVHWDQTIPEAERGEFEAVVSRFVRDEGAGILNWLIEGVKDFMTNGLVIAPSVTADTKEYREDMDPVGEFLAACVRPSVEGRETAHALYEAYHSWSLANAKRTLSQNRFGKRLKQLYEHGPVQGRVFYRGVELHDVPDRPDAPQPQDRMDFHR